MRDIRFRGFNQEAGEWVYGYYTKLVEGIRRFDAIICDIDGELTRFYIHDQKTIEQYTGLKDIKKKEVYENDKVIFNGRKIGTVKMLDGIWTVEDIDEKFSCFLYRVKQLEIIGNIHEEKK